MSLFGLRSVLVGILFMAFGGHWLVFELSHLDLSGAGLLDIEWPSRAEYRILGIVLLAVGIVLYIRGLRGLWRS